MIWQIYNDYYGILIGSFLVFVLLKLYFIRNKKIIDGDVFTYHLLAKQCEVEKKIPSYLTCYCIDAINKYPFDYPFLFIYLFSLLPQSFRDKKYKYINFVLQIFSMVIIGCLLSILIQGADIYTIVLGVIFIFMTPGIVRTELDFCARTFAENIYMCIVLLWLIYMKTGIGVYLIPVVLLNIVLLYMHKFETQVFLFLGLIFLFVCGDVTLLIGYCMVLLVLMLFSSKYRTIFFGHCRFLMSCLKKLRISKEHGFLAILSDSIKLVFSNPAVVLIIYIYSCIDSIHCFDGILFYCFCGAVGLFLIGFVIKNVRWLFFIGSGDRYIDYSVIFTTCFVLLLLSNISIAVLNIMILLYFIIDLLILIKFYNKEKSQDTIEIMEIGKLLKFRDENNIFVDKAGQFYNLLSYQSGKAVFGALSSYGVDEMFDIINNEIPLDEVIDKYDIEILISGADSSFQDRSTHKFLCIYIGENWKAYVIAD